MEGKCVSASGGSLDARLGKGFKLFSHNHCTFEPHCQRLDGSQFTNAQILFILSLVKLDYCNQQLKKIYKKFFQKPTIF